MAVTDHGAFLMTTSTNEDSGEMLIEFTEREWAVPTRVMSEEQLEELRWKSVRIDR